jgi:hypothetical protein
MLMPVALAAPAAKDRSALAKRIVLDRKGSKRPENPGLAQGEELS